LKLTAAGIRVSTVAAAIAGLCSLSTLGCSSRNAPVQTEEEPEHFASSLPVNVPNAPQQLTSGVFDLTNNTWRWTAQNFSVTLGTPMGAAQKGATLKFDLAVPGVVVSTLHSVTLNASIAGTALGPESYSKEGPYTYTRDVPSTLFKGAHTRIDFALDKFLPPVAPEKRELGVLAFKFELDPK
jgi:hypothetical protein